VKVSRTGRPSITETERLRSANLLQTPRGPLCKLRQRGREYGGPAGSRGIGPSLQPTPFAAIAGAVLYGRAAPDSGRGPRLNPNSGPVCPACDIECCTVRWPVLHLRVASTFHRLATQAQKEARREKGFEDDQIATMTPEKAHQLLDYRCCPTRNERGRQLRRPLSFDDERESQTHNDQGVHTGHGDSEIKAGHDILGLELSSVVGHRASPCSSCIH
jgi:hypothetical protein